uniref:FAF domain-containing protein n=1 Tax=Kalanchoe fedtschenkoi TaxID=63787 RepID=A0A7N0VBM6_KALFE
MRASISKGARAPSKLSSKSLELCTENLGSESGTDIIEDENNIFSPICFGDGSGDHSIKVHPRKSHVASSKRRAPKTFPPPLSTMTGSEAVQVRPIRENGRLMLQAVKVQPKVSCFQAERSNGRLRLRLLEHASTCSSDLDATDNEYANPTRDDNDHAHDDFERCSNNSSEGQQEPENRRENVVRNSTVGEGSSGLGNIEWQGSCKEGGDGNAEGTLLDSESFWVAAS